MHHVMMYQFSSSELIVGAGFVHHDANSYEALRHVLTCVNDCIDPLISSLLVAYSTPDIKFLKLPVKNRMLIKAISD